MKNKKILPWDYIILATLITLWLTFIGVFGNFVTDLIKYGVINKGLLLELLISVVIIAVLVFFLYKNKKKFKFYKIANEKNMEDDSFKAIILPISTPNIGINFYYFDAINEERKLSEDDVRNIKNRDLLKNFIEDKNIRELYLKLEIKNNSSEEGKITPLPLFSAEKKDNHDAEFKRLLIDWLKKINEIRWNWSVPLIIAAKNFNSLRHIRLIGTTEGNKASFKDLYRLKFILLCLFSNLDNENGILSDSIKSFENFTELTKLLNKIEKDLEDKFDYKDEEIAFDITGGQKPVSVVGTFFTLKSRTPILYISQHTSQEDKEDKFGAIKEINAIINIEPPE